MLVDRVPVLSLEILQHRTQVLSSSRPLERREGEREREGGRERDHGMVWSHESEKLKTSGRGPCISIFVFICFVTIIARLSCSIRMWSVIASRDVFTLHSSVSRLFTIAEI